jgi:hypothetical protein
MSGPSLEEFKSFTSKDVKKWVEKYEELEQYGPAMEDKVVTGRVLLEATEDDMKDDLRMTSMHARFLRREVSKIIEGERWESAACYLGFLCCNDEVCARTLHF